MPGGDPEEPGPESPIFPEGIGASPGAHQSVHQHLLCIAVIAGYEVGNALDLAAVCRQQVVKDACSARAEFGCEIRRQCGDPRSMRR